MPSPCQGRAHDPSFCHRALRQEESFAGVLLSVDTFQSAVAREAVEAGADLVNDVSGGLLDDAMFSTVQPFGLCLICLPL